MSVIKGGNGTDEMSVDPISKAAHVTLYDTAGNVINPNNSLANITIDANNTTIATLGAGAAYNGTGTDISNYSQINIDVYGRPGVVAGDASSAKASLYMEFSKDNSNWDISIPQLIRDPSLVIPIPLINVHKYFRVRYLNDGGVAAIAVLGLTDVAGTPTAQTAFRLTTYLLPSSTKELVRTMDQAISGSDPATLVRAGIMGKNPTNTYVNKNQSGISNANNSTAILGAGAIFNGTYEEVLGYNSIIVNIDTDLAGTLTVDFSSNGTNITQSISRTFTNTSSGQTYVFIPSSRYFKLRYTNTAGTQAYFRLQTIFKSEAISSIFLPADSPLTKNSLVQAVLSVPSDGIKTTYSASIQNIIPVSTPTDLFTITGSATKTIRVLRIAFSAVKTAASTMDVLLIKRSTANSGGTSSSIFGVPHDSNNNAATATVLAYSVNPTLGTAVGTVRGRKILVNASGTAGDYLVFEFGKIGQAIVLRGINDVLAINLNGVTMTGGLCNVSIEWTEE